MLKKIYRLPSYCFKKIYHKGRTKVGRFVVVKSLRNFEDSSRFGIIISAKVVKKATKRNLIKRRISEIIGQCLDRIHPKADFVIIVKREADFPNLKEEIERLLNV